MQCSSGVYMNALKTNVFLHFQARLRDKHKALLRRKLFQLKQEVRGILTRTIVLQYHVCQQVHWVLYSMEFSVHDIKIQLP